jgi:hypothetical protein
MSDSILRNLACHGVLVVTYPPHTSHIFRGFDVLLFGILKRSKKYQMPHDGLSVDADHILRLFGAYEAATLRTVIRAAWRKAGFESEKRNMTIYLRVNERQIRESSDFREIWMFDSHDGQRSARL